MIDNIITTDAKPHFLNLSWLLLSRANVLPDEALALVLFAFQMEILEEENLGALKRAAIFFLALSGNTDWIISHERLTEGK